MAAQCRGLQAQLEERGRSLQASELRAEALGGEALARGEEVGLLRTRLGALQEEVIDKGALERCAEEQADALAVLQSRSTAPARRRCGGSSTARGRAPRRRAGCSRARPRRSSREQLDEELRRRLEEQSGSSPRHAPPRVSASSGSARSSRRGSWAETAAREGAETLLRRFLLSSQRKEVGSSGCQ